MVGELRFLKALGLHELLVFFALPYAATPVASHCDVLVSVLFINAIERVEEAKQVGRAIMEATYQQMPDGINLTRKHYG